MSDDEPPAELTAAEYRERLARAKPHKYAAQRATYAGEVYPSRLEARVAEALDLLRHDATAGRRRPFAITRQPRFDLVAGIVYVADFAVTWDDGAVTVLEVKGFETDVWRLKHRLFRHCYPQVDLRVIREPAEVLALAEEGRPCA